MSTRRNLYLLLVGLVLIAASLACGLRSPAAAPPPAEEEPVTEELAEDEPPLLMPTMSALQTPTPAISLPDAGGGEEPQPAVPESRRLTLEFPPVIRTGDSVRIRMQLEMDDRGGIVPTAVVEGNVVTGEVVEIPNLYETHFVVAEARLDMAGMEVQPPGTISEPLMQGQSVTFYWSVRPKDAGRYEGTAWLHLRFVPRDGGEESRIPVSVQFLEIEAKSFMGMFSGGFARSVGAIGSAIGSVLGFPFFEDIVRFVFRKPKRKRSLRN